MTDLGERMDDLAGQATAGVMLSPLDIVARHGGQRRRRLRLAVAVCAVGVVVVAAILVRSSDGQVVRVSPVSPSPDGPKSCSLPSLGNPAVRGPLGLLGLGGPAVASLHGGAAVSSFDLDNGELTVTPPGRGDVPSVSANQAECAAMASISLDGTPLVALAQDSGIAFGYGQVSVSPALIAAPVQSPALQAQTDDNTKPVLPPPAAYQQRPAWLVVVDNNRIESFAPDNLAPTGQGAPTTAQQTATSYGYVVFLIDADTGSDALLYTEGAGANPGGSVSVPAEQVSVPWSLVSRSSDGYPGKITATVLPCDGYPEPVAVDRDRAAVGEWSLPEWARPPETATSSRRVVLDGGGTASPWSRSDWTCIAMPRPCWP